MVAKTPVTPPAQGGMGNQPAAAQPAQPAAQPQP